jgi:hypothetical protein
MNRPIRYILSTGNNLGKETAKMGLLPHVAARELGISSRTLDGWARAGKIAFCRTAGGWRLYDEKDVQRLKKEMLRRATPSRRARLELV